MSKEMVAVYVIIATTNSLFEISSSIIRNSLERNIPMFNSNNKVNLRFFYSIYSFLILVFTNTILYFLYFLYLQIIDDQITLSFLPQFSIFFIIEGLFAFLIIYFKSMNLLKKLSIILFIKSTIVFFIIFLTIKLLGEEYFAESYFFAAIFTLLLLLYFYKVSSIKLNKIPNFFRFLNLKNINSLIWKIGLSMFAINFIFQLQFTYYNYHVNYNFGQVALANYSIALQIGLTLATAPTPNTIPCS